MTRKNLDIDPEVSALLARIEKKRKDNLITLGEIVVESGVHKLLDGDQLRQVLIRARDEAIAAKTRDDKRDAAGAPFPGKTEAPAKRNGHADPEPARPRPPDLLEGAETT